MEAEKNRFWIHGLAAGATVGVLAGILVMRLNPEVPQPAAAIALGVLLWASWGVVLAGLPIVGLQYFFRRLSRRENTWPAPGLEATVYLLAGVLAAVNADLSLHLLSDTARRVVLQDAVAWFLGALLALVLAAAIRGTGAGGRWKVAFSVFMIVLPAGRLLVIPTTSAKPLAVVVEPIGSPAKPLLVVGAEGFDVPVLLTYSGGGRTPMLERLANDGAWGTIRPYKPYLRQSYWTSVATGTYPGAHGVKAHWGWDLPWLDAPLRLMPWTPQGSRLIHPWWLARRVTPPPATVPALWERLRRSGVGTEVLGWPGFWSSDSIMAAADPAQRRASFEPGLDEVLEVALAPFVDASPTIWSAIRRDQVMVDRAVAAFEGGATNVWLHLETLAETRRLLEPLKPRHTGEREVVELVVELLDSQLHQLVLATPPDALIVVVSPVGLSPPSSYERLRRLVGIGDTWRSSGDQCWDGVLMISGRDVVPGRQYQDIHLPDVVPTVCYLLGLPLAQYMEGSVIISAVEPDYLATHPLVVDP